MLSGLDIAAIEHRLNAVGRADLEDLRSYALDELNSVRKLHTGRATNTLPAAAVEGDVTIDRAIRAIASLGTALCGLLDQETPA